MRLYFLALSTLFILFSPIMVVANSAVFVVNSSAVYDYSINQYNAEDRTGVPKNQLFNANKEIIRYFQDSNEHLDIKVTNLENNLIELFNAREIHHMRDVKTIMQWLYRTQAVLMGLCVTYLVLGIMSAAVRKKWSLPYLGRTLATSGILSGGIVLFLGVFAAMGGFRYLFLQFHFISFSNDLWILDPNRDKLIQMFPEPFFFDATMLIAGLTLGQIILSLVSGLYVLFWHPQR